MGSIKEEVRDLEKEAQGFSDSVLQKTREMERSHEGEWVWEEFSRSFREMNRE